jgi:hypothetical protein
MFCQKLSKIAENCDHSIDPRMGEFLPIWAIVFLGCLFLIKEGAQISGHFFLGKKLYFHSDKKWVGL